MQSIPWVLKLVRKDLMENTVLITVLLLSLLVCVLDSAWCLPWAHNFISACFHFCVRELTATIGSLEGWGQSMLLRHKMPWKLLLKPSSHAFKPHLKPGKGVKLLMFRGGMSCSLAFLSSKLCKVHEAAQRCLQRKGASDSHRCFSPQGIWYVLTRSLCRSNPHSLKSPAHYWEA